MAFNGRTFLRRSSSQNLATKSEPCLSHIKTSPCPKPQGHVPQNFDKLPESRAESPERDGLRFMLFRECDVRGRKLLYDSAGPQNSNKKYLQILEEMVFGSAALSFHGDTYKLHDFSDDNWEGYQMMLTKIFQAQPVSLPSQTTVCGMDSGFIDQTDTERSGSCSARRSSLMSSFTSSSTASSVSVTCENTTALTVPRLGVTEKAASDSMIPRKLGPKRKSRKLRLAVVILFSRKKCDNQYSETNFRDLILHRFSLVEVFLQHLQFQILQAFFKGAQCIALLNAAVGDFQKNCANVWSSPGHSEPAWKAVLTGNPDTAHRFVSELVYLAHRYDTKLTQFFLSTLLTAVLTYHVSWVYSFAQKSSLPDECHNRIVLLSQDPNLAEKFMFVLSYFVRCPYSLQLYDDAKNLNTQIPRQKKHSSSSMEIRNAAVVPEFNALKPAAIVDSYSGSPFDPAFTKSESGNLANRRSSQQPEKSRYLRDYFDARFAAEKQLIKEEDFGSFKNAIMRGSFQELTHYGKLAERENSTSSSDSPNFFVGSIPEAPSDSPQHFSLADSADKKPAFVEVPSLAVPRKNELRNAEVYSAWSYAKTVTTTYVVGKTLQALKSPKSDWLDDVRQDLCAVACLNGRASCIIADIDKSEVEIFNCDVSSRVPLRLKESWSPVSMSGLVSCLVESTVLMWDLSQDSRQCVDHVESRLKLLCRKSEELAQIVSSSVNAWSVGRITSLLGVEAHDLSLLLAACSVHSSHICEMVGLSLV